MIPNLFGCNCCRCQGKHCLIPHLGHDHETMPHKWISINDEDDILALLKKSKEKDEPA